MLGIGLCRLEPAHLGIPMPPSHLEILHWKVLSLLLYGYLEGNRDVNEAAWLTSPQVDLVAESQGELGLLELLQAPAVLRIPVAS